MAKEEIYIVNVRLLCSLYVSAKSKKEASLIFWKELNEALQKTDIDWEEITTDVTK